MILYTYFYNVGDVLHSYNDVERHEQTTYMRYRDDVTRKVIEKLKEDLLVIKFQCQNDCKE